MINDVLYITAFEIVLRQTEVKTLVLILPTPRQ